jgi:hypothetical protein
MSGTMTPDRLARLQADAPTAAEMRPFESGTSAMTPDLAGRAHRLNAIAFARGADVDAGPGQEAHLAHEAWHVVQQQQGRVHPTLQG